MWFPTNSTGRLAFVINTQCVYSEVGTEISRNLHFSHTANFYFRIFSIITAITYQQHRAVGFCNNHAVSLLWGGNGIHQLEEFFTLKEIWISVHIYFWLKSCSLSLYVFYISKLSYINPHHFLFDVSKIVTTTDIFRCRSSAEY